jgi:molybdate transport system substrate-binding protein
MGKLIVTTFVLLVAGVAALFLLRTNKRPRAPLQIYCGTSMRPAAEELARDFERETDVPIQFDFGGSETLLPKIEIAKEGDIFITHDPFGEELARKEKVERYVVGGCLIPVLIVAKGNPLQLRGLADLAKPGVKLGLMDARYSTCGQMVRARLAEKGLADSVGANVKVEKRSHQDLALDVALGALDAALVWNFSAELNRERVDAVWLDEPFPETRLVVCLLKCTRQRAQAERFLALCDSEKGRAVFGKFGYRKK